MKPNRWMRGGSYAPLLGYGVSMALLLAACAADTASTPAAEATSPAITEATSSATASPTATPVATATPEPTPEAQRPTEPGDTAWFELVFQDTGQLTQNDGESSDDFHVGYVFSAGTLDAGQTARMELPERHAFADDPRDGKVLVGSDDGATSELLVVDAATGDAEVVLSSEALIWGGTLAADASSVYYVPVDRASMTDAGLWRLALEPDAEAEQLIEQFAPSAYDFASQHHFAWSPDGDRLVAQYCNRHDCVAHIVDTASGESRRHDAAGVFELRGATDSEYIADATSNQRRSGILAVDFETLEVRVVTEEWGVSEAHRTDDGPLVVYFAPDQPPREIAIIGVWLDRDEASFVVYEDRDADTLPEQQFSPGGTGYEAPTGWILMWPGPPGPDPEAREPEFLLLNIASGEERTFPYEVERP